MVAVPRTHEVLPLALHCVAAVLFSAATSFLEPCLKSVASLLLPQSYLGRSFGVLAMVASIGDIVGNVAGTQLYAASSKEKDGFWLTKAGGLPFSACSAMLCGCAIVVWCVKQLAVERVCQEEHRSPPESPRRCGLPGEVGLLPSLVGGGGVQRSVRHRPAEHCGA